MSSNYMANRLMLVVFSISKTVHRVFGTSMVEEYEEIADSQYQSERQELFDEDYGRQITSAFFLTIQARLVQV